MPRTPLRSIITRKYTKISDIKAAVDVDYSKCYFKNEKRTTCREGGGNRGLTTRREDGMVIASLQRDNLDDIPSTSVWFYVIEIINTYLVLIFYY